MKVVTFLRCGIIWIGCFGPALGQSPARLVWSDEFNYSGKPSPDKWSYDLGDGCPKVCGWGNNELQYYTGNPKNARVENGSLIIEAHTESKGGKRYTSARLISKS